MRYLGIDYGLKRLGLAVCDASRTIVSPLCRLHHDPGNPHRSIREICKIVKENEINAFVVGLPLNMDGSEGEQARRTRVFADRLRRRIDLPVRFQDERLSTAVADEQMNDMNLSPAQRRERRDALAACVILREFLDAEKNVRPDG